MYRDGPQMLPNVHEFLNKILQSIAYKSRRLKELRQTWREVGLFRHMRFCVVMMAEILTAVENHVFLYSV